MKLIDATKAIESIDDIVCSMSVCINSDYCNGMRAMKDMTLHAIEEQPTVDAVPVVFINDPFHVVYQAFKELYPDKECEILFDYNVETTDTHERVKGVTIFPDDGSIPQIRIDCEQTIDQISGILAHELAHVALGKPEWDDRELDHGEDFEKVLDAIFDRFNELQGFCADGERRSDGKQ